MEKNKIYTILVVILVVSSLFILMYLSIFYRTNKLFSRSWDGFSQFTSQAEKHNDVKFYTISDRYLRSDRTICSENNTEGLFIWNSLYHSMDLRFHYDFCLYMAIFSIEQSKGRAYLYDINSTEKRSDLIVANFIFEGITGKVLFRFPTQPFFYSSIPDTIAFTRNSVYYDSDSNMFIDYKDYNRSFPLIYSMESSYYGNETIINNPSIFTNDLINKYDNKKLISLFLGQNDNIIIARTEDAGFLSMPFDMMLSFKNFLSIPLIIIFSIIFLLLMLLFFALFKTNTWMYKLHTYADNKFQSNNNSFYGTVRSIYNKSNNNKYFYKWIVWMQLKDLKEYIDYYFGDTATSEPETLEEEIKLIYPALLSIDLKTIIFYISNISQDFDIKDMRTAQELSRTVNFVLNIMRREI